MDSVTKRTLLALPHVVVIECLKVLVEPTGEAFPEVVPPHPCLEATLINQYEAQPTFVLKALCPLLVVYEHKLYLVRSPGVILERKLAFGLGNAFNLFPEQDL